MKTNDVGLALIKRAEGLQLLAYRCPAGKLSIGYGHTGSDVREGMEITPGEAERLLLNDLSRAEYGVNALIGSSPTNENQFSALVSFAYNLGLLNLQSSTLLRKHKKGDFQGAADQFPLWCKARVNGNLVKLPGLVKRREDERELYLL